MAFSYFRVMHVAGDSMSNWQSYRQQYCGKASGHPISPTSGKHLIRVSPLLEFLSSAHQLPHQEYEHKPPNGTPVSAMRRSHPSELFRIIEPSFARKTSGYTSSKIVAKHLPTTCVLLVLRAAKGIRRVEKVTDLFQIIHAKRHALAAPAQLYSVL